MPIPSGDTTRGDDKAKERAIVTNGPLKAVSNGAEAQDNDGVPFGFGDIGEDGMDDTCVAQLLQVLGFGAEELQHIISIIPDVAYLRSAGVSPTISDAIKEAHQGTWYHVQGSAVCTRTRSGSKAGDPLGDLLFNFIMVRTRSRINTELADQGLLPDLPAPPAGFGGLFSASDCSDKLIGSTYVDDDAVPVLADTRAS